MNTEQRPDDLLSVPKAAARTGIAERTIRYWIQQKRLRDYGGGRGKRVSLADVIDVGTEAGKVEEDTADDQPAADTSQLALDRSREQLAAIRDEWLQPLIARIGELEHERGTLEGTVRLIERERDDREREISTLQDRIAELEADLRRERQSKPWYQFWS